MNATPNSKANEETKSARHSRATKVLSGQSEPVVLVRAGTVGRVAMAIRDQMRDLVQRCGYATAAKPPQGKRFHSRLTVEALRASPCV